MEGQILQGVGQILGGISQFNQAKSLARAYTAQANQILQSGLAQMETNATARERARGAIRSAYADAGVRMSGTAAVRMEEQERQDDLTLLAEKYNLQSQVSERMRQAKAARRKGRQAAISGSVKGGLSIAGGFI